MENESVKAVFDEDINPSDIINENFEIFKIESGGSETPVQGNVSYDVESKTAIFTRNGPFQEKASYRAVIYSRVKDLAGNSLSEDKEWIFRHLTSYETPCKIPGFEDLLCCIE